MRARIVYHNGTLEKLTEVATVVEHDDRFEFTVPGFIDQPLHYPKTGRGVKFVQVTWHAE